MACIAMLAGLTASITIMAGLTTIIGENDK
jgi:hypothetical protein